MKKMEWNLLGLFVSLIGIVFNIGQVGYLFLGIGILFMIALIIEINKNI